MCLIIHNTGKLCNNTIKVFGTCKWLHLPAGMQLVHIMNKIRRKILQYLSQIAVKEHILGHLYETVFMQKACTQHLYQSEHSHKMHNTIPFATGFL